MLVPLHDKRLFLDDLAKLEKKKLLQRVIQYSIIPFYPSRHQGLGTSHQ
jgi:hypothetical protein